MRGKNLAVNRRVIDKQKYRGMFSTTSVRYGNAITVQILQQAKDTLKAAEMGYHTFVSGDPNQRIVGLKNLVTFGRSVTWVLQNLRKLEPSFDGWYKPIQEEMANDHLMKYFVTLRNEIEKQGRIKNMRLKMTHLHVSPETMQRVEKPPAATNFFISGRLGGAGWEVPMPDGTIERYMVEIPKEMAPDVSLIFDDQPSIHLGKSISNASIQELAEMYISYLKKVVLEAHKQFLHGD